MYINLIKAEIIKTLWDIKDDLYLPIDILEYYLYLLRYGFETVYFTVELHGEVMRGKKGSLLFWDKLTDSVSFNEWDFDHCARDNHFLRWHWYRPQNSDELI